MKMLVVSTSFPKSPGDGLSPFVWEYCLNLKSRGWQITVLVPHHPGLKQDEDWQGIRIRRFRYLPEKFEDLAYSGGLMPGLKKEPWKLLKIPFYIHSMYSESLRILAGSGFDLVNFHWLFPACFWLRGFLEKSGIPAVMTGHGTDVHLALKHPFRYFANKSLPVSSALTINSEYMMNLADRLKKAARTEVIPMGVDSDRFSPGLKGPSASKKILFIGRLIRQKGIGLLLDSMQKVIKEVPDSSLEIIGFGPLRKILDERVRRDRLKDHVRIRDPVRYDSLPEVYRSARVLALPSLIPEGLGMTAIEAGSCGLPTITFGLGGTSEFVRDRITGMIAGRDTESLAQSLIEVLKGDGLADRLGQEARRDARQRYSWSVVSARFDELLRGIVNDRRARQQE